MKGGTGTLMRRFSLGFVAAAAMLIAVPAGASAATQIGETFTPNLACDADTTWLQGRSPSSQYAAPTAGVITRWSHEADAGPSDLKFKVGRRGFGSNFTIIGESGLVSPDASTLNSYFVQIPVEAGDVIGLYTVTATGCRRFNGADSGYELNFFFDDVEPGTSEDFGETNNFQLDVSALLEPDCDKDGLGDETQDGNLSACGLQPPTCRGERLTIVGTPGNDTIVGTGGRDVIAALGGNDEVIALDGNDVVCGNGGSDKLRGQDGNDRLKGNRGVDRVKGASGDDNLKGNRGEDTLKGKSGDDTLNGGRNDDTCRGGGGDNKITNCES